MPAAARIPPVQIHAGPPGHPPQVWVARPGGAAAALAPVVLALPAGAPLADVGAGDSPGFREQWNRKPT